MLVHFQILCSCSGRIKREMGSGAAKMMTRWVSPKRLISWLLASLVSGIGLVSVESQSGLTKLKACCPFPESMFHTGHNSSQDRVLKPFSTEMWKKTP